MSTLEEVIRGNTAQKRWIVPRFEGILHGASGKSTPFAALPSRMSRTMHGTTRPLRWSPSQYQAEYS